MSNTNVNTNTPNTPNTLRAAYRAAYDLGYIAGQRNTLCAAALSIVAGLVLAALLSLAVHRFAGG